MTTPNGMRQYDDRMMGAAAAQHAPEIPAPRHDGSGGNEQAKALMVLTMAQRTAEEHIETARREAEQIRAEAHAAAGQIVSEAQAQAGALREEAEKLLNRARMTAEKIARDAEAFAVDTERNAGEMMGEAQARAEDIVRDAQENAHSIKQRAEQIYEDVVGGLTSKRAALQAQIESLERFDHEYRARLTTFMQQQMRALWVGQPQVEAEFHESEPVAGELLPAGHQFDDEDDDEETRD
ncbi:hypothetical protein AB0M46_51215 [Dactylosporangium sp. NPDC051485]|uniref:DivIVA domain-containing protein n=1 Tax=Dactylosporangium sp. NPDC051485 TaxID=3154846 RepID=UPI003414872F